MKVELIYDLDCPNVKDARAQLLQAFVQVKMCPSWTEWDRKSEDAPEYVRRFGSPTILVDGEDVDPEASAPSGSCCRLYSQQSGVLSGVPHVDRIASALSRGIPKTRSSAATREKSAWKAGLTAVLSIGLVLLPKLSCAACWPAYTALLSALGFGFFDYTSYLLPITITALAVTLLSLMWRAKNRWGYGPLALGSLAALIHVIGKFVIGSNVISYSAVPLLIGAAIWNAWPRTSVANSCNPCASVDAH
jgi:hypothetical protein